MTEVQQASQRMREIGLVQYGAPVLVEVARPFDLPAEREAAEQCVEQLYDAMERIGQVHPFAKGMGLAAPQIGIGRAAAAVQPPGRDPRHRAAEPRITETSEDADEQYEGCLSFFDVRGMVPPPADDHGGDHRARRHHRHDGVRTRARPARGT
ncbi:peptide deformylase [Streptomyces sp. NPDC056002]|uniref:peptide deformylase n=1 Tax=Streptomyces sp. NPDC056002 TaxID=3345675 RepID=UPI0035D7CE8A